jgi:hypothetical protein
MKKKKKRMNLIKPINRKKRKRKEKRKKKVKEK